MVMNTLIGGGEHAEKPAAHEAHDEKQLMQKPVEAEEERDSIFAFIGELCTRYSTYFYGVLWILYTAYFIASLALKKVTDLTNLLPFILLYAFITLKYISSIFSFTPIANAIGSVWTTFVSSPLENVSRKIRLGVYFCAVFVAFLVVALALPTSEYGSRMNRLQSLLGIIVIVLLLAATSRSRNRIQWTTVFTGLLLQLLLGLFVLKTTAGQELFKWIANVASGFLEFSSAGLQFLFGQNISGSFATSVFPAIIFFVSFIQMVYYLGGMQWLVGKLSWFFTKVMNTSGAESVVASASPFVGQGESAVLVANYVDYMTASELHATMASGFSTISGSVLAGYLSMGANISYLLTSCIMSIPCSLALSKLRYPEMGEPLTRGRMVVPDKEKTDVNLLHAAGNGAALGMTLVLLIAASLIAIVSLLAFVNYMLTWFGNFVGITDLTLNLILGYVLYPFAWLLGVSGNKQLLKVAYLLATKIVANEFVAYADLYDATSGPSIYSILTPRNQIIVQFALCGFANLASIGVQIGAIGAIAPSRKKDLVKLAFSAMITGATATCVSATIAAILI
ncbi:Sodium/nucleoside cotransporter 2 [Zancudomyces culisetae]|uniref:Sodium/nucleoside cotransporter 2 n=1 Tax=Zancudomyces culisetae TaxID=1213189 RepID=A0A1R1PFA4_ZANCU|nr:Sodium/nucleoside cotransporter 2 [Zancudomyces culisetae]|eukprot:OMH79598.1 Sodium/nucleoside cotransporter 2 [Zancudomyces culisetae]